MFTTATPVNGTTPETFLLPLNCDQYQWCLEYYGYVTYLPSIAGNAFFLAAFTIGLLAQIFLGIRYKAWTFTGSMLAGILLEIIGYGGRIGMHNNIFIDTWFIMVRPVPLAPLCKPLTNPIQYLCCLTIGPAFFSAALYLSLSRIITIFGTRLSLLRPRTITLAFITFDFLSLLLQAIGGALASTANTHAASDIGVNIMVAGLSTQLAATTAFAGLCLHLMFNIRRRPELLSHDDQELVRFRQSKKFRLFLCAIAVGVVTILVRCAFRVAELSEGFKGKVANNEALFMVFDSAMMVICVVVLSAGHPGFVLKGRWALGKVSFRNRKGRAGAAGAEEMAQRRGVEKHAAGSASSETAS